MSSSEESFKLFGFKQTLLKVFCSMIYCFQLKINQNMKCNRPIYASRPPNSYVNFYFIFILLTLYFKI